MPADSLLPRLELPLPRRRIVDGRYHLDERSRACHDSHERTIGVADPEAHFRLAIEATCQRHDLPTDRLCKFPAGFNLVYAVGDEYVIKLYCGYFPEDFDIECAALRAMRGDCRSRLRVWWPAANWRTGPI